MNWWMPKEGMIKRVENEFFRNNCGWKIHLKVREESHEIVFRYLLGTCPYSCKYKSADEDAGKDFTIYVGSFDETEKYAEELTKNLEALLERTERDAAISDLNINDKVSARFQPPGNNSLFVNTGFLGIPLLRVDLDSAQYDKPKFDEIKAIERAYGKLNELLGNYFTGSRMQVRQILDVNKEIRSWWKK